MMSSTYQPSTYQQAIYEWIGSGSGSAVVEAVAGSGKTTTVLEGLRWKDPTASARLFAFNTAIADTLKAQIQGRIPRATASTFHAAGYAALARHFGVKRLSPTGKKLRSLIYDHWSIADGRRYGDFVVRLVGLAKGEGVGIVQPDTPDVWQAIVDHHGLYLEDGPQEAGAYAAEERKAIEKARALLRISTRQADEEYVIDFDDLLYLPLFWELELDRFDWVLVDEAQDTNPVRRRFIEGSLREGGRVLAVGDRAQSIYGFTGASVDALDQIQTSWRAEILPLSICYRCARAIVREAQAIVPQIEAAPGASVGKVQRVDETEGFERLGAPDAILCRTNAPLVRAAYDLIRRGIGCTILGREIGQGLIALVEKLRPTSLRGLEDRLGSYQETETAKLKAKKDDRGIAALQDKVDCLQVVIERLRDPQRSVQGLKDALRDLFEDTARGRLTLSTIHKAKGKEWPQVGILRPDLLPAPWARQDWEIQQEINLQYVAITRAQETLLWLDPPPEDR